MFLGKILPNPLPGEHVVYFLRRHRFTFFTKLLEYFLLLAVPLVVAWVFLTYFPEQWESLFGSGLSEVLLKLGASIYYLGVWVFLWTDWVDYYLDVWIVTNERIISVEQKGLFNRFRSELRLSRVEDVSTEVKGFFATILHFGDVTIQTAGMEQNAIFRMVPRPYQVSEGIIKLTNSWRKAHPQEAAQS